MKEDDKIHHNADNLDPSLFTKNKSTKEPVKISSLSTKECEKIENPITEFESEGGSHYESPSQ